MGHELPEEKNQFCSRSGETPSQPPDDVISGLLSFYGSQLTSHASLVVGLIVAMFALVQTQPTSTFPSFKYEFAAFAILTGIAYSILRLVLYGFLSSATTNVSYEQYLAFKGERRGLSEHGIVIAYVGRQFRRGMRGLLFRPLKIFRSKKNKDGVREAEAPYAIQLQVITALASAILVTTTVYGWQTTTVFGLNFGWSSVIELIALVVIVVDLIAVFGRKEKELPASNS